jgi:ribosomal protein L13
MRTHLAKPAEVVRKWYVIDASGKTLGRLSARVAILLRGKHKPTFTPNVDTGDHVVIINAEKIHLTGDKMKTKTYTHHTGYPGGLKTVTAEHLHDRHAHQSHQGHVAEESIGQTNGQKTKSLCQIGSSTSGPVPRITRALISAG